MNARFSVALLLLAVPVPAAAQNPDSTLIDRIQRLEVLLATLQEQLAEQAPAFTAPAREVDVTFSGQVLVNAFFTNARVNTTEVPTLVLLPDPADPLPVRHAGATARQTRLGLRVTAANVLGARFEGVADLDFFGGQLAGGRSFPLARLRRARVNLAWPNAWIMLGQDASPIAELDPSSVAADGFPEFAGAGNLWRWLPQVRAGLGFGRRVRVGVEAAAVAPTDGSAQGAFATQPDRAERTRRPFVQGRLLITWPGPLGDGLVSVGGHQGWIAAPGDVLHTTSGIVGALRFPVTRYAEVRGEAFTGEGLGVLGEGGANLILGPGDLPIRTQGGWVQLNLFPAPEWELGGGLGIDNPDDADINAAADPLENQMWEGHLIWRPRPLLLGFTFRHLQTNYGGAIGGRTANHINMAAGFVF